MEYCLSCNDAVLTTEEDVDTGTCASCRGVERNEDTNPRALDFRGPRRERFVDGVAGFLHDQRGMDPTIGPEPEDVGLTEEDDDGC
jgi:hypothetical protein